MIGKRDRFGIGALRRDRRGAAAMEFAMVVPPLMLMLFGTIEFGRLLWTRDVVKQVAVEGARCMGVLAPGCSSPGPVYSLTKTQNYIVGRARGFGVPLTNAALTTVTRASNCASPAGTSNASQVQIQFTFNSVVPRLVTVLAAGQLLTVSACQPNQS